MLKFKYAQKHNEKTGKNKQKMRLQDRKQEKLIEKEN